MYHVQESVLHLATVMVQIHDFKSQTSYKMLQVCTPQFFATFCNHLPCVYPRGPALHKGRSSQTSGSALALHCLLSLLDTKAKTSI